MRMTIARIGNSQGLIFDSKFNKLARLKPGDLINLEVHAGGTITLTPLQINKASVTKYRRTVRKFTKR